MTTIKYRINILSDWHIGSGLSAGVIADNVLLKDRNKMPYIPGKTIKGLLRDSINEVRQAQPSQCDEKTFDSLFGKGDNEQGLATEAFYSNATVPESEYSEVVNNKLTDYLYRNVASTAINKQGVAKDGSLRSTEVCQPLTLEGYISGIKSDEEAEAIGTALQWTRHLGMKRTRGLGRVKFELINQE